MRILRLRRTALACLLFTPLPVAFGQTALTTAQIAKRVSPSVVVIQGKTDSGDVLGSGFIVSKDGKTVTNLHVIREMRTASVQLASGEVFDAVSVLAIDERRDLAVVQIGGFNLPALELGNSDALMVGEPVVIVGSPRGLEGTVTAGILSSVRDSGAGFKVLQTDAAVNPGNSGGPLVNNKGQAIGVVSFKLLSAEGLNFAIPANYVRGLLNNLHEPMTLEQMRGSLSAKSTPDAQSGGPSLKETLDWLKEKIPMGITHWVSLSALAWGLTDSHSLQSAVWSFDSCTVEFGFVANVVADLITGGKSEEISVTDRYAVPLGRLAGADVGRWQNAEEFVSGDEWSYGLSLSTTSKEIRAVHSVTDSAVPPIPTEVSYTDKVVLYFNDESIVQRVKSAFLHAADLCRGKQPEPF
ncbi:MAG: trypsin-like peptidase domain-containing protein [Bryobacteraceae bacterium]